MDCAKAVVSVLIPNWNGAEDTVECIETLLVQDYGAANLEILVVDNGSEAASLAAVRTKMGEAGQAFYRTQLIELGKNKGIAVAYNTALQHASSEATVLLRLDNDVLLPRNAVSRLMQKLGEASNIGIVGCRIISYDMSDRRAHHCGTLKVHWWSPKIEYSFPDADIDCDGVAGCAMLIRRNAVQKLSWFFDPRRFLASELDLCQRVKNLGYRIVYTPSVEVFHKGGRSTSKKSDHVRFETILEGYLFHFHHNRLPAVVAYFSNALSRALLKCLMGDSTNLRAMLEAWTYFKCTRAK